VLCYDDKVKISFHEGAHKYVVQKKVDDNLWTPPQPVLGTTSVLSVISKPALMKYPMNKALEYLQKVNVVSVATIRQAKLAHVDHSNAGKKAGKVGHALVEALQAGKQVVMPTDPEERKAAESVKAAYEGWCKDFNPEVVGAELVVYSLLHDFAGTYDLLARINGKLTIIDYKTTNPSYFNPDGIYGEYFAQLGAYSLAHEEMTGETVDDLAIVNLPKNGEAYRMKSIKDIGMTKLDCQMYFLNALGLFKLNRNFEGAVKQ